MGTPGSLWGWVLQGDSGVGHSSRLFKHSEGGQSRGSLGWALQGVSAVGHSRESLGWGSALQTLSHMALGLGTPGGWHSRRLAPGTLGVPHLRCGVVRCLLNSTLLLARSAPRFPGVPNLRDSLGPDPWRAQPRHSWSAQPQDCPTPESLECPIPKSAWSAQPRDSETPGAKAGGRAKHAGLRGRLASVAAHSTHWLYTFTCCPPTTYIDQRKATTHHLLSRSDTPSQDLNFSSA